MSEVNTDAPLRARVREDYKNNDPPVEPGQFWVAYMTNGDIGRKIRILAPYPDFGKINNLPGADLRRRSWLFEEHSGKMLHMDLGRIGVCPEFNLRYVFKLVT